jgi:large subunit ribosomal protein L24
MRNQFSISWKGSRQKRKQRKYRYNAPLHLRQKMISANLNKELRKKYGKRNIELRKDDKVKVMRGEFTKKEGKVIKIDLKKLKIYVDTVQITKKDGSKINPPIDPSNLQIMELVDDRRRLSSTKEIKQKTEKK